MNKKLGFISLFISSILFSTYGIFGRILNEQLTVFQQLSVRYAIGAAVMLGIIFFIKKETLNIKKFLNIKIGFFALLIPISFYFFIRSFIESKLSVSISGFYAGTIISSLCIGYFFLKEKITSNGYIGLILVLFSFAFLNNLNLREITNTGLIWGLLSGVGYGITSLIKKKTGNFSREEILLIISVSTAVVLQSLSLINHEAIPTGLTPLTVFSLFAFMTIALSAEYLTIAGFRNFDLFLGSIVLSMEIVFTIIVGILFFKEVPTNLELMGITLIIVSVIFTNLPVKAKVDKR